MSYTQTFRTPEGVEVALERENTHAGDVHHKSWAEYASSIEVTEKLLLEASDDEPESFRPQLAIAPKNGHAALTGSCTLSIPPSSGDVFIVMQKDIRNRVQWHVPLTENRNSASRYSIQTEDSTLPYSLIIVKAKKPNLFSGGLNQLMWNAPDLFQAGEKQAGNAITYNLSGNRNIDLASFDKKRSLLLIHGTFGNTGSAFFDFIDHNKEAISQLYEDRVWAFDHNTLKNDVEENVQELIKLLGRRFPRRRSEMVRLPLDILTRSRGGLVARELMRQSWKLKDKHKIELQFGNIVMVAPPNQGTPLGKQKNLVQLCNNISSVILGGLPNMGSHMERVRMVGKIVRFMLTRFYQTEDAFRRKLAGISCQAPGSEFLKALDLHTATVPAHKLYAVGANYTGDLHSQELDKLFAKEGFGTQNDYIVPLEGMFCSSPHSPAHWEIPVENRFKLDSSTINHLNYFKQLEELEMAKKESTIISWLRNTH